MYAFRLYFLFGDVWLLRCIDLQRHDDRALLKLCKYLSVFLINYLTKSQMQEDMHVLREAIAFKENAQEHGTEVGNFSISQRSQIYESQTRMF